MIFGVMDALFFLQAWLYKTIAFSELTEEAVWEAGPACCDSLTCTSGEKPEVVLKPVQLSHKRLNAKWVEHSFLYLIQIKHSTNFL